MAWFAIYRAADGALYSTGSSTADESILAARNLVQKSYEIPVDMTAFEWNPATLDFVARPPLPVVLSQIDFKRRLTQAERIAIRASDDPIVIDFRDLLDSAETVDLSHPDTDAGINYLEAIGLIAAGRAQAILDG